MDQATAELLKQGILGVLLVLAGAVIYFLYRENKTERVSRAGDQKAYNEAWAVLQAQRVADAQAVTAQLLKINQECVTVLTHNSSTLEASQESMGELKQAFRDLEQEVRARPRRPGG